jgi:hypothetical protein
VELRTWQDALKAYLLEKGHISAKLAEAVHEP